MCDGETACTFFYVMLVESMLQKYDQCTIEDRSTASTAMYRNVFLNN